LKGNVYFDRTDLALPHEIAHQFAFNFCGFWGSYRDPELRAMNPPGFQYNSSNSATLNAVANEYGAVDIFEDDAMILENEIPGLDYEFLEFGSAAVREKYVLWLERMAERVPNIDKYLI